MCHDLDQRSYLQGQGHNAYIWQISVPAITFYSLAYCHVGFRYYLTQLLSIWVMDIYPRSRSQYRQRLKSMPWPLLFTFMLDLESWIIFHTIVGHDQRVCHDLKPMSSVQGKGHIAICTYSQNSCLGYNSLLYVWFGQYFTLYIT